MKLKTDIENFNSTVKITQSSKILTVGSCFSNVIGNFFLENKVTCLINPFGTVYNLASIEKLLNTEKELVSANRMAELDGIFFNYNMHSKFYGKTPSDLKEKVISTQNIVAEFIKKTDFIIITLGTSWVYFHKESEEIVSNCHKQNSKLFEKVLLTENTQLEIFSQLYKYLIKINSKIKIILTISPVRHLKDGLSNNNLSKSILRVLCESICRNFQNTFYFPSYEIMIDDLRDYRFYKEDLIHPSEIAEKYIIGKFSEMYFDDKLNNFLKKWAVIYKSISHKPFNESSTSHQIFLKKLLNQLQELSSVVELDTEISYVKKQLQSSEL